MRHFRPSLTVSIMAFLGCLLLITWLLFSMLAFKTAANDLYAQKGEHAKVLLTAFTSQIPPTIDFSHNTPLNLNTSFNSYTQNLLNESSVVCLAIFKQNGEVIFYKSKNDIKLEHIFSGELSKNNGIHIENNWIYVIYVMPIYQNNIQVGKAAISLTLDYEKERLNKSRQILFAYFMLDFILLFFIGSFILSRIIVKPIDNILTVIDTIIGGQYGQRINITGSSELALLAESINNMSYTLKQKEQLVLKHVTAIETANIELQQAREESIRTEKMASIGLLAAGMAHEIGTPLASISGYAELLSNEGYTQMDVSDYASRISRDCERIDRIIRGLLDYSRPRTATTEQADICKIISDTIELLLQQGAIKNIQLVLKGFESGIWVQADPYQLQQVFINVLLNSRDAMLKDGQNTITISTSVEAIEGEHAEYSVRIVVSDTGTGIAPIYISKIFDPFFTTKEPGKGTGLGLAIAVRIIEGFGGKMNVDSCVGSGTNVTIHLSLRNREFV